MRSILRNKALKRFSTLNNSSNNNNNKLSSAIKQTA
jgi:hypothetical protein